MATRFAQQFARTGAQSLMLQFGDSIGYRKGASGDSLRTISAMIERNVELLSETGDVQTNAFVVRVKDDATEGISSTEVDTGVDQISVPLRVGETAQWRSIVRVVSTENGLVRFLIQ